MITRGCVPIGEIPVDCIRGAVLSVYLSLILQKRSIIYRNIFLKTYNNYNLFFYIYIKINLMCREIYHVIKIYRVDVDLYDGRVYQVQFSNCKKYCYIV